MDGDELMKRVRAIPWARLAGAYGSSERVVDAFANLVSAQDADSDEWRDAVDTFFSHVTHQGTLYEVSAATVPFLASLASCGNVASRDELLGVLDIFTECAEHHRESDAAIDRLFAEQVLAALAAPVEPVELPPRVVPVETEEQIATELEAHARSISGAPRAMQAFAVARAAFFLARAPELALRVAEAADDSGVPQAMLLRARALAHLGRSAEALRLLTELVERWLEPARAGTLNQWLVRGELLAALDDLGPNAADLRATIARAPEPDTILSDDDAF